MDPTHVAAETIAKLSPSPAPTPAEAAHPHSIACQRNLVPSSRTLPRLRPMAVALHGPDHLLEIDPACERNPNSQHCHTMATGSGMLVCVIARELAGRRLRTLLFD